MCRLLLMTIALLLILFGISGLWMMPRLVQQKIEQRLQLKIGTKTFDRFTKVPIPLTVKFYIFNITNSERVLAGLERPQFQEVGPFVYQQWRRREIIDFEDYNRRLRYKELKTYYPMFNHSASPASSNTINNITRHNSDSNTYKTSQSIPITSFQASNNTTQDDNLHNDNKTAQHQQQTTTTTNPFMLDPRKINVTIVNLPLLSVLTKLAHLEEGSLKRSIAAKVAKRLIIDGKEKMLVTRPANELLFDGYKVDFMESAKDLVSGTLGFNFVSPLPNNKFGFFYMKNNTWTKKENGELTVFTGRNDSMDDFMLIENWNDQKQLSVWPKNTVAGNRCNEIHGTDGSQFHPGANKNQLLSIFSPMICTSLRIQYKEETQARDIPLLRFTTPADVFGAPKKNTKNACYCTIPPARSNQSLQRINDSRCYLDGLIDLSLCQRGAPIAASSPHFYNGDPMLAMAAGLKPNKDIHETYLDIEPMTGAVMRAASRAQLNAYVEQAALEAVDSSIIGHMTPMVAPLIWFEESAEIDEKSSAEFKNQLLNLVQKAKRTFIVAIVFGVLLALAVGGQYCYITYKIDVDSGKSRKKELKKRGTHLQSNIKLGSGARKSNFYSKTKPALLNQHIDDGEATFKAATPVIAAAAIFGAASAGPSNRPRSNKDRRRGLVRSGVSGDGDEDLSKKLVANEWDVGEATTASSSGRSSDQGVDHHQRPGGSQEDDEEPCSSGGPHSRGQYNSDLEDD